MTSVVSQFTKQLTFATVSNAAFRKTHQNKNSVIQSVWERAIDFSQPNLHSCILSLLPPGQQSTTRLTIRNAPEKDPLQSPLRRCLTTSQMSFCLGPQITWKRADKRSTRQRSGAHRGSPNRIKKITLNIGNCTQQIQPDVHGNGLDTRVRGHFSATISLTCTNFLLKI